MPDFGAAAAASGGLTLFKSSQGQLTYLHFGGKMFIAEMIIHNYILGQNSLSEFLVEAFIFD